ncbi:DNA repair protein XRCC1 [Anopheles cruzii]|uniref:DNA repair protein XRCC1 n=1 Tax=Anopheles cruzii TaxID=68878 RepID=UPI0022EC846B|nr:DNA repair protein XRCC1 [Anopheles cruzii]
MPAVNFKSIESFSSEDPNFPATNLLKPDNRKWKCREAGEKCAFVVISLDEPAQLCGIDIGNEHSAFIEVLVARSGPSVPTFNELLLATKFMNTVESRNSSSTNRVQCFTGSSLLPTVAQGKWDLVKVLCTQPFNSRVKYGLTFVTLHTSGNGEKGEKSLVPEKFQQKIREESGSSKGLTTFGRFKLREESPDSDDGSKNIFARWKQRSEMGSSSTTATNSVAAMLRDAKTHEAMKKDTSSLGLPIRSVATIRPKPQKFDSSSDDEDKGNSSNSKVNKHNRNDASLLYDPEDSEPMESLVKHRIPQRTVQQPDVNARPLQKGAQADQKPSKLHDVSCSKFKEFLDITGQSMERESKRLSSVSESLQPKLEVRGASPRNSFPSNAGRKSTENSVATTSAYAYNRMSPLPIVRQSASEKRPPSLSGNGKQTSPPSSKKTKYVARETNPTREESKRVTYKPFYKLLEDVVLVISGIQNPDRGTIRSQALAMGAKYRPDWDSSCTHLICAYKNTPKYNQVQGQGKIVKKEWIEKCYSSRRKLSWRKFALDTAQAQMSDSEDEIVDITLRPPEATAREDRNHSPTEEPMVLSDSEPMVLSDSEPELDGHADVKERKKDDKPTTCPIPYEISTEEEMGSNHEDSRNDLDFFNGKTFFLDNDVGAVDTMKLKKYIQSYKGVISNTPNNVEYIISRRKRPLPATSGAQLVKPLWIFECNEMECLIPVNRYLL